MTEALFELGLARGQWRLAEIQIANWGTFDESIYRIPVARKGHLITGPSGSGKSSLLDAIATVLTPDKWLRFNVAAQGVGARSDQRSNMTYVRGAWTRTADELEDRVVSSYLRPGATWSAILLRYENDVDAPATIGRAFFAKGTSTSNADLSDVCLVERSPLDVRDLEPFLRSGIETRKIQANWPDAVVTTNGSHAKFYARMRSLFGIQQEAALQLLHKTQSAKSLDSLDQLFRDYMLDEPETFRLAKTAVEQFDELRDAHDHVVRLRMQRDHLLGLRTASEALDAAQGDAEEARRVSDAVLPYQRRRVLVLARDEQRDAAELLATQTSDAERASAAARRSEEDYDIAQRRVHELGGGDVDQLRLRIGDAETARTRTYERWELFQRQLSGAGVPTAPTTAAEFAELMAAIDALLASEDRAPGATYEESRRATEARATLEGIDRELDALRRSGTTVPSTLLAVRQDLAESTGLPVSALPFGAELIDVKPDFAAWTGAIERVLRPFALTMLVRSEHLARVRRWVDEHRIGVRLVFEEVERNSPTPRPVSSAHSLVNRVAIADGPFSLWTSGLLSERYDVACVESVDDLDDHVRAVTINGQIKSSRTRYEKDDRVAIDDRSHWVLGDREGKLEALVERRVTAQREHDEAKAVVDAATARQGAAQKRAGVLGAVRQQSWNDMDRDAAAAVVADLTRQLAELTRGDGDLQHAVAASEEARGAREMLRDASTAASVALSATRARLQELREVVRGLEAELASGALAEVDTSTSAALDARYRAVQRSITRATIAEVGQQVQERLHRERDLALDAATRAGTDCQRLITEFVDRWEAESADLTPSIADRRGFLEMLDEIVAHGLPDHESRFLELLRERSRDLIGELRNEILGAPREIEERVRPVNRSLRQSPFDEGRYLRLRVKTRRSDTVNRFMGDVKSITEGSWSGDGADTAEERFALLAELMRRFSSSDHVDRVWTAQCLDTRLHVTFLAEEVDEHDRVHATYDSGAAMSGGQQQKLVVFCLAAALRYRLADPDAERSRFGTIVLDEAFDKADSRYTRMALDVFVAFGFQLVLATPQKLLQTIEPYVGAATSIENPTRRRSTVANVSWSGQAFSPDAQ